MRKRLEKEAFEMTEQKPKRKSIGEHFNLCIFAAYQEVDVLPKLRIRQTGFQQEGI